MKIGISQLVLKESFDEVLRLCQGAGYEALELRFAEGQDPDINWSEKAIAAVGERCRAAGIVIPSIVANYANRGNFLTVDAEARNLARRNLRRAVEIAAILGVQAVLLHPGQMDAASSYTAVFDQFVADMREQAENAARLGVIIGVENVWNKFLLSPLEACQLVDAVGSPALRIYLDVGNMMAYGFPEQWIRDLGPRICRVHLKDFKRREYKFVPLMDGDAPWPSIMSELRAAGYEGCLVHEVSGDYDAQVETARRMRLIAGM